MQSIVNPGIFTSHGFLAAIFIAFGLFLFYKGLDKNNRFAKADKKIYITGVLSVVLGIMFLFMYIGQIKGLVA